MIRGRWSAVLSVVVALCALASLSGQAPVVTVIRAGRLIVGTGAPPLDNAAVVIEGDLIKVVGRASDVPVPAGATVIDLSRHTVLPGLIDAHDHITSEPGDGGDSAVLKETAGHAAILVEELGVPPLAAITMATSDAAALLGMRDKGGSVEAGRWADLIAVVGNPLDNIRLLETPVFVMKAGAVNKGLGR